MMPEKEREELIDQMMDIMENHESFDGQSMNHNTSGSAKDILKLIESKYILSTLPKMSKEQITKAEELISDTIRKVDKLFGLL